MNASRPILLVAEAPRRHTPALQRAFDLAQRSGAPVHVLLEAFDPLIERAAAEVDRAAAEFARERYLAERRAWVDALVDHWRADGLRATGEVLWSPSAYRTIVHRAVDLEPQLVVKDDAPATGVRRALFAMLDWKLVRYCPAPLMLVHPASQHLPQRILAAVDTAASDDAMNARILEAARRLGRQCRAAVHVAHAFALPPGERPSLGTLYERIRDDDAAAFGAFAAAQGIPAARRHFLTGPAAPALGRLARALDVDLLVLGSAHRPALDRLFVGSTASVLVRDLARDVLLVKPEGFADEVAERLALTERQPLRTAARASGV